jgi:hypothetical protein
VSVQLETNGTIALVGVCPVEDAEILLQLLQSTPTAPCDWTRCGHLHTAVVQVILAVRPALIGPCGDPWLEQWISPQLGQETAAQHVAHPNARLGEANRA